MPNFFLAFASRRAKTQEIGRRSSTAATATKAWASLLLLAGHLGEVALGHTLDDADGDGAAHVAHGEAAERR